MTDLGMEGMPTRFGKYTLIRKIASGGMAELFLALQKSVAGFEKLLVIKRILPPLNQDHTFIEMLLSEARIAATLSHPNIVQIFDVGQEGDQFYIAMEHVHGEDLRSIVRQMKRCGVIEFPLEHALAIVMDTCAGLAYAHEMRGLDGTPLGIVHRDISPQNIVVTFTGDVKIVDFGIAKSDTNWAEQTQSGKLKGKVPYMSPEQARGDVLDARSDIFAAGTMLFELTTGRRLFKGQSEYETLKLICDREYPRPSAIVSDYPPELEAIVMRALAKDREQRYQSARHMQADIEAFVRSHRIAASSLALSQFMQSLFSEKLAEQKALLLQGKHLADIIESQRLSQSDPSGSMEISPGMQRAAASLSMPAATRTVTAIVAPPPPKRSSALTIGLGAMLLVALGIVGGAGYVYTKRRVSIAPPVAVSAPVKGSLAITSDPAGASIWINGDLRPEVTPATIANLPTGVPLDVKLTMDGFEHAKRSVTLTDARPSDVNVELKKVAVTPSPSLRLSRPHEDVGAPSETKHLDVQPAPHHAPAHPPPHGPAKPAAPAANGKLNVGASGGWCNVTVDGTARGATPVAGVELSPGPHKVTCTTPDGKTQNATVTVPSGDTARYKFAL